MEAKFDHLRTYEHIYSSIGRLIEAKVCRDWSPLHQYTRMFSSLCVYMVGYVFYTVALFGAICSSLLGNSALLLTLFSKLRKSDDLLMLYGLDPKHTASAILCVLLYCALLVGVPTPAAEQCSICCILSCACVGVHLLLDNVLAT